MNIFEKQIFVVLALAICVYVRCLFCLCLAIMPARKDLILNWDSTPLCVAIEQRLSFVIKLTNNPTIDNRITRQNILYNMYNHITTHIIHKVIVTNSIKTPKLVLRSFDTTRT